MEYANFWVGWGGGGGGVFWEGKGSMCGLLAVDVLKPFKRVVRREITFGLGQGLIYISHPVWTVNAVQLSTMGTSCNSSRNRPALWFRNVAHC